MKQVSLKFFSVKEALPPVGKEVLLYQKESSGGPRVNEKFGFGYIKTYKDNMPIWTAQNECHDPYYWANVPSLQGEPYYVI